MGLAEDKVYTHITRNLKKFGTIRVASLADSLTCLVDSDRDELLAREETRGNQAAVFRFYQHLRCRRGWVQDLIQALHQNNAGHLADELQEVYDTWQSPPRSSAAAAPSSLPSDARPAASSLSAQTRPRGANAAPWAGQAGREPPVGASTELDARLPVQESLPKKCPEQENPRAVPAVPSGAAEAGPSPERGRDWQSRRPVCVDNGFFGNAKHLQRGSPGLALGRSAPPRAAGGAQGPGEFRNEPEENSEMSAESPPGPEGAARRAGQQLPNSVPKKQQDEAAGSSVGVRGPLLIQEQFDAEKKLLGMLPEQPGTGGALMENTTRGASPVPGDAFPPRDTSVKVLAQEEKLPTGKAASSSPSVPAKEKVLPAPASPAVGISRGTAGRSESSATILWAPHSAGEKEEELSKPGALVSLPREPENPGSLGLSSDPILVSRGSSGRAFPGASSVCEKASRDSSAAPGWDGSPGTHELRVDRQPSGELGAGSPGARPPASPGKSSGSGANPSASPGNFSGSGARPSGSSGNFGSAGGSGAHPPASPGNFGSTRDSPGAHPSGISVNPSSAGGSHGGPVNPSGSPGVPKGGSGGLSLLYLLPALGVASAVALAVYARLRK